MAKEEEKKEEEKKEEEKKDEEKKEVEKKEAEKVEKEPSLVEAKIESLETWLSQNDPAKQRLGTSDRAHYDEKKEFLRFLKENLK